MGPNYLAAINAGLSRAEIEGAFLHSLGRMDPARFGEVVREYKARVEKLRRETLKLHKYFKPIELPDKYLKLKEPYIINKIMPIETKSK